MMKHPTVLNLSSPVIKWAQHRANSSNKSFFLMPNFTGGLDIVPTQLLSLDQYGDVRQPIAVVHPQIQELDDFIESKTVTIRQVIKG